MTKAAAIEFLRGCEQFKAVDAVAETTFTVESK